VDGDSVRLDPKAAVAIGALALIILIIIFIELCGRDEVEPLTQDQTQQQGQATAELGPTFTPGPSPTIGPALPTESPTPMVGGRDRDAVRVADMQSVQVVLGLYEADNGEFPTNEGTVQTLCVFTEFDVGCELLDVVDRLPEDPLGDASVNGYWYASDGQTYELYAQRESDAFPVCTLPSPDFLQDFDSLLCVLGP
jgi:hypothetical protein